MKPRSEEQSVISHWRVWSKMEESHLFSPTLPCVGHGQRSPAPFITEDSCNSRVFQLNVARLRASRQHRTVLLSSHIFSFAHLYDISRWNLHHTGRVVTRGL